MFLGTYTPRLDEKGRLILPAKFRDELSAGLVLTKGQERCLYAFPMREFEGLYARMRQAIVPDRDARGFQRVMLASAVDEVPDKQGRITVPPMLREYAGLERDLCVTGAGARVEIWDAAVWESYLSEAEAKFAETAAEVIPGLL